MRSRVRRVAASLVLVGLLAGCASDPDPSPPAGVDELTIPTPSPDPDDFVADLDNPWLALEPGSVATLSSLSGSPLTVRVAEHPVEIAGVATTELTLTPGEPAGGEPATYHLAQDRRGNVWRFVEGAEPGLFMPATPRYGDGFRTVYDEGVLEERAEVTALDGDRVEIRTSDPVRAGVDRIATYQRGVGLVRLQSGRGVFER